MTASGKADLKKLLKAHYSVGREPVLVDIGAVRYLMIDGTGDPNASPEYVGALGALYAAAYRVKSLEKAAGRDFVVPPLEGLWWASDMDAYLDGDREAWEWTMMIAVPGSAAPSVVEAAVAGVRDGGGPPPSRGAIRLERYEEGRSAHVLHLGPYADERPTIERLHRFIEEAGLTRRGRHHEVYLNDPRRTSPDRLKTIIRQPVGGTYSW